MPIPRFAYTYRTCIIICLGETNQQLRIELGFSALRVSQYVMSYAESVFYRASGHVIQNRLKICVCVRVGSEYRMDAVTASKVKDKIKHKLLSSIGLNQISILIPFTERTMTFTSQAKDKEYTATASVLYQQHGSHSQADVDRAIQVELEQVRDQFINTWTKLTITDIVETFNQRPDAERRAFVCSTPDLKLDGSMPIHDGLGYTVLYSACVITTESTTAELCARMFNPKQVNRYRPDSIAEWLALGLTGIAGYVAYKLSEGERLPVYIQAATRYELAYPIILTAAHTVVSVCYLGMANAIPHGLQTVVPLLAFGPLGLVYQVLASWCR